MGLGTEDGGYGVGVIRSYRDLRVWQVGMELAEAVYRVTRGLPASEL